MGDKPDFADWLAICNVKADYCRLLDLKDWEGWKQLFTEDCRMDTTDSGGSVTEGREGFVAAVRSVIDTAKTAHQVHSPQMQFDGDGVDVIWAMQDRVITAEWALTGYGHYYERYVRTGDGWRIASLKLTRLVEDFDQPRP